MWSSLSDVCAAKPLRLQRSHESPDRVVWDGRVLVRGDARFTILGRRAGLARIGQRGGYPAQVEGGSGINGRWLRPLRALAGLAAVTPGLLLRPAAPLVIDVQCNDCGDIPWWAQAILTVIGIGIAMVILYVPYRLSRRISSPRTRAVVRWGGVVILLIGLVILARVAVLVLPDD
jgi:hypothetical protein